MNPRLFVSYSWSSEQHAQWVLDLATELRQSGVDVILDKWDLKEGNDAHVFMEKMVTDPEIKKVILVCDKHYAEKADKREGGVGTETQIISPEIYSNQDQNKFVAVISEKDENGNPYLPTYYKSRIYIDLSNTEQYALSFDQLLRWIYDKPLYIKPEIGTKPAFLDEPLIVNLGTTSKYKRAVEAIKNYRPNTNPSLRDYFDSFAGGLEQFRIVQAQGQFDDFVIKNIEQFLPYRNEILDLFIVISQYSNTKESHQLLFRFFENLLPYLDRPENVQFWNDSFVDNFKFIIHELFLYLIAAFIKYEAFDAVAHMVHNQYLIKASQRYPGNSMRPFSIFRSYLRSLEDRNTRLNLRRLSLQADLLEQRCKGSGFQFEEIMQADFVLYLRDCLDVARGKSAPGWYPVTLLYARDGHPAFEIFARSQSIDYFKIIAPVFEIEQKEDFQLIWKAMEQKKLTLPRWEYHSIEPQELMNFSLLATR